MDNDRCLTKAISLLNAITRVKRMIDTDGHGDISQLVYDLITIHEGLDNVNQITESLKNFKSSTTYANILLYVRQALPILYNKEPLFTTKRKRESTKEPPAKKYKRDQSMGFFLVGKKTHVIIVPIYFDNTPLKMALEQISDDEYNFEEKITHLSEKTFWCFCGKSFFSVSDRNKHRRLCPLMLLLARGGVCFCCNNDKPPSTCGSITEATVFCNNMINGFFIDSGKLLDTKRNTSYLEWSNIGAFPNTIDKLIENHHHGVTNADHCIGCGDAYERTYCHRYLHVSRCHQFKLIMGNIFISCFQERAVNLGYNLPETIKPKWKSYPKVSLF